MAPPTNVNSGGQHELDTSTRKQFCAHAQPKSVLKAPEPVHVHHDVHDKDSHQTHKLLKQVKFTPVTVGVEVNLAYT